MKRCTFLIFMIINSLPLLGQSVVSPAEILRYHDSLRVSSDELIAFDDFIASSKKNISRIEKMEFRTETDRWDVARQEYAFRTSLKSQGETSGEKQLLSSWQRKIQLEEEEDKQSVIKTIYEQLVELYVVQQEQSILTERLALMKDKQKVLHKSLTYDDKLSVSSILKADDKILDVELDLAKLETRSANLAWRLGRKDKYNWKVDFGTWKSIEDIRQDFLQLTQDEGSPVSILIQEEDLRQREIELMKEKAKGGRTLDFLQMKYSANESRVNGSQLSLGAAFIIPSGHSNKENIREANIDLFRESAQAAREANAVLSDQLNTIAEFQELESEWLLLTEKIAAKDLEGILAKLAKTDGVDAETLLEVKDMILDRQLDLLELEKLLYESYLELAELKGKLGGNAAYTLLSNN